MDSWDDSVSLAALSPLDGRYAEICAPLRELFSEGGLIRERVVVEVRYWLALLDFLHHKLPSAPDRASLLHWAQGLSGQELLRVKVLEAETRHDVKAVEYYIREHARGTVWEQHSAWIHWGLTSEDTDNLAYGRLLTRAVTDVIVPAGKDLSQRLLSAVRRDARVVMLARTHGQVAVPTTLGKEWAVFLSRASFWLQELASLRFGGKANGAVGNYNAQVLLYPDRDWRAFGEQFVRSLGLEPTPVTTQIEPATRLVLFLDQQRQLNNVWLDLAQNAWLYVALGALRQRAVPGEVGSSTMPHKVNPIHFENAEGNLQLANALLAALSDKLSLSRLQRDLSDKTAKRNLGAALGHTLVAMQSLQQGLQRVEPDEGYLRKEVAAHPEVLAEALQLHQRVRGEDGAFAKVASAVRGTTGGWTALLNSLDDHERRVVSGWQPETYIGLATELALSEADRVARELGLDDAGCQPGGQEA